MVTKPLPNGFGTDILDTAVLAPNYCIELVERFDMAQVTVVDATHPKEAFYLATRLKERRPHMTVFYRRWRETLKDERIPFQTTPAEIVEYFRDCFEAGLTPCIYNESLISPMSILADYSKRVIDLTAPKGWESVHFKIATGNPGGYAGEQYLPKTSPGYRPDGYAESDLLWETAYEVNKPRIDAGKRPLVWVAPHAYFAVDGKSSGNTDRFREVSRRLEALGIPRHYVPMSLGETGIIGLNPLDAESGWVSLSDASHYADIFIFLMSALFHPGGVIPHLFAIGDKHPGDSQWKNFNLMGVKTFWDKIETITKTGAWRVPYWYGEGYGVALPPSPPVVNPPPVVIPPAPTLHELEFQFRYTGLTSDQAARLIKAYPAFLQFLTFAGKNPDALAIPELKILQDGVLTGI